MIDLTLKEAILKKIDDAAQAEEKNVSFPYFITKNFVEEIESKGHKVTIDPHGFTVEIDSDSAVVNWSKEI